MISQLFFTISVEYRNLDPEYHSLRYLTPVVKYNIAPIIYPHIAGASTPKSLPREKWLNR